MITRDKRVHVIKSDANNYIKYIMKYYEMLIIASFFRARRVLYAKEDYKSIKIKV